MRFTGRVLNAGYVRGEAVVIDVPFSFIGDVNPTNGEITLTGHHLFGTPLKGKIMVIPTGKGGTIAPYIAYQLKKNDKAPLAILCNHIEPVTLECALTMDIPVLDGFMGDITKEIKTGDYLEINEDGSVRTLKKQEQ
ncbi:MAG: DUF126 domain-containing protein [Peptococcaceae bacterium]|nr:DUF126 domain-containing protein [Peptococcaceae bacterium]MDH7525014.1 DUF126 domain-containing protein [Peptococcaceae bacterium]